MKSTDSVNVSIEILAIFLSIILELTFKANNRYPLGFLTTLWKLELYCQKPKKPIFSWKTNMTTLWKLELYCQKPEKPIFFVNSEKILVVIFKRSFEAKFLSPLGF